MNKTTYLNTYAKTPIKQLSVALRPRERLQKYGADYIELHELIAIIIRSGTKGKNALDIAKEVEYLLISRQYDTLTIEELTKVAGISKTKATEILAAYELGKRVQSLKSSSNKSIQGPEDCLHYLSDIANAKKEHFVALYLDTKNVVIHKEIVSIGTLDASLVHPREVFEPAFRHSCARIILAHNHPSGDTTPSQEDITVTKELLRAGELLGIAILDHVVVGKHGWTALSEPQYHLF